MLSIVGRPLTQIVRDLLTGAFLSFCILPQASAEVLTSIRPLAFITSAMTEGVTTTNVLLPDGASPHSFALRPSDLQKLRQAELVVWVGPELEVFLEKPLSQLNTDNLLTLSEIPAISTLLLNDSLHEHHHDDHEHDDDHHDATNTEDHHQHGARDMHIWLSPKIAKQIAIAIQQKLIVQYPTKKTQIDVNLRQFIEQIEQVEKNIGKMLDAVQGKGYFVFHDAYRYFESSFNLKSLGYFTINPEIQPGAQRLHTIRTQLVEQKAACVFAEPQFRPAVINAVTKGTSVRKGVLDPLGSGIAISKDSYAEFLMQLSAQFVSCLKD